jgi:hypothetical protein
VEGGDDARRSLFIIGDDAERPGVPVFPREVSVLVWIMSSLTLSPMRRALPLPNLTKVNTSRAPVTFHLVSSSLSLSKSSEKTSFLPAEGSAAKAAAPTSNRR